MDYPGERRPVMNWQKLKLAMLKTRIAYHRRQVAAYSRPVVRSFRRETYIVWMRNRALRHSMKAHDLERELLLSGG